MLLGQVRKLGKVAGYYRVGRSPIENGSGKVILPVKTV
jgi:hypothetical protein